MKKRLIRKKSNNQQFDYNEFIQSSLQKGLESINVDKLKEFTLNKRLWYSIGNEMVYKVMTFESFVYTFSNTKYTYLKEGEDYVSNYQKEHKLMMRFYEVPSNIVNFTTRYQRDNYFAKINGMLADKLSDLVYDESLNLTGEYVFRSDSGDVFSNDSELFLCYKQELFIRDDRVDQLIADAEKTLVLQDIDKNIEIKNLKENANQLLDKLNTSINKDEKEKLHEELKEISNKLRKLEAKNVRLKKSKL